MKVLFVATVVKTHIMEFHIPYLQMFQEMGWETAVAAKNDYENPVDCQIPYCNVYYDVPFERNPLQLKNVKAYQYLRKIVEEGAYDMIHCHTPVGAMLTRLAARKARKNGTKVIYTAHGFHFYRGAPLINWLVYYPVEKWLSKYTDVLITINKEDYELARSKFRAGSVEYVPGVGIDTSKFTIFKTGRDEKRRELRFEKEDFILLSVGELIPRKNHEVVLKALSEMKAKCGLDKIHYLICGRGQLEHYLKDLAVKLGIEDHVHFLGYRGDISDICNCSDVFVFMSLQEGLPVALMEAMACGLPVICTEIRGNVDLVTNGVSGVYAANDPADLGDKMINAMNNKEQRMRYAENARRSITQYDLKQVKKRMYVVYGLGDT